ncbi:ParB/RepB/Spo0J family partition protein [Streptomyces sp. NPDC058412]|uniref:ParB/RepB/Spo0J family partition protein n=1 Tax=Streptomyces sp. NPDC058412 TaxID=3346486 RepID=UPI003663DFD9
MTPPAQRVTRGFSIDEDGTDTEPTPRRIRTRQQIMAGEGKRPPAAVPLTDLAHNPFNPRTELLDVEETAESLRAKGQIQPVTVVRREAFLTVHPGQEDALGSAPYVVIDGNRRLAAAHAAGLNELRIDVHDGLAESSEGILESALIANIHRVDVDPLDQARALKQLVEAHGEQKVVAARLGKTPAWVSQRLSLLKLPDDLQDKVEAKVLTVKDARRIGGLPADEQHAAAEAAINRVKPPRKPRVDTSTSAASAAAESAGTEAAGVPADTAGAEAVTAAPSVPVQSAGVGTAGGGDAQPINPVNRTVAGADAVTVFADHVSRAKQFAIEMEGIASIHRKAVLADWQKAEALLDELRHNLALVTQQLPAKETDA